MTAAGFQKSVKRETPIEALLHWAYQIELVNLDPREANPMFEDRVSGGGGAGYEEGAIARIVAPDAIAVSKIVAMLDGQEWTRGVAWTPISVYMDGMSVADRPFIEAAIPRAQSLVVCNAKLGARPHCEDWPEPTADRSGNGQPRVMRVAEIVEETVGGGEIVASREMIAKEERARVKLRAGIYPAGSYCLLKWFPSHESVMRDRAEYVVWRAALAWLRGRIGDTLDRISVLADLPPERPWNR